MGIYVPIGVGRRKIYIDYWIDFNKNGRKDPYEDPFRPIEERVNDLLSIMTLEEKLEQLRMRRRETTGSPGSIAGIWTSKDLCGDISKINDAQRAAIEDTRLGIPVIFLTECLHGCMAYENTQFPQAIALAATWNPRLVYRVAKAIAREVRARGMRQCLSPVVNLARDIRCGRTEETYGEDPYLASAIVYNFCKALREEGVIATLKHFAANYVGEGGRDSHEIHMSEKILRETEFQPFYAGVKAGALSVMAAYNSLDGVPCSANKWLLTEILRWEWGFNGYVISDGGSVPGLVSKHGVASTPEEAVAKCLEAGLEVELPLVFWGESLDRAVREGLVSSNVIDEAVRRVLRTKFLVGLFEEPYVRPDNATEIIYSKEHMDLAYEASQEAIVLLKNENSVLPVDRKNVRKILVIGGAARELKLGGYSGIPREIRTPIKAIEEKLHGHSVELTYLPACPIEMGCENAIQIRNPNTGLPVLRTDYVVPPKNVEGKGVRMEVFDNPNFEGKPLADYVGLYWVGFRYEWGYGKPHQLVSTDNYSVRFKGRLRPPADGKYRLCIVVAGGIASLIIDGRLITRVDTTGTSTYSSVEIPLMRDGHEFTLEYSRTRGYAAVRFGWDIIDSEEIRKATEEAKKADVVLFFADIIEGEEEDRAILRLPRSQERLIEKLLEANRNIVVVLITGSPVVGDWIYKVPAIVEAWYPGQEGGRAIADVLFGDYNPAGRLPITWPHHEGQLPLYYNYKPSGRVYDYVNMTGAPLFPFGHGLSYTRFQYSNLKVSVDESTWMFKISIDVENTGELDGDEVVQLYVRDIVSTIARPVKELKRFERVYIKRGEKKTVSFTLNPDDFAYYDSVMRRFVEPGEFEIMIGSSSENIRLKTIIKISEEMRSKPGVEITKVCTCGTGILNIEAKVSNNGLIADLLPIKLIIDGRKLEEHRIYLEPGESRIIVFTEKVELGIREVRIELGEAVATRAV
ncbi:MAG: glycoside hydrolase family 3 N-terminal domain-containing protein [Thermoproteota archaeon]